MLRKWKILFVVLVVLSIIILTMKYSKWETKPKMLMTQKTNSQTQNNTKPKIILLWNGFFTRADWYWEWGSKQFVKQCPVSNCYLTGDKEMLYSSDAIGLHVPTLKRKPAYKLPHQRWIFFMMESQCQADIDYSTFNGQINWTMTYRGDSDIIWSYGTYEKREKPVSIDFKPIVAKKKKLVAWFVSNCRPQSRRNIYVRELSKFIKVDIYGRCGNHVCNKDYCTRMVADTYKYYLSFESRFSAGYITEKFYRWLNKDIVPIVRGYGNYMAMGPPNSFIDTRDFKSIKDLADYLKKLAHNDEKYIEYLQWKQDYVIREEFVKDHPFCKLCEKLNNPNEPPKVYNRIDKFWDTNDCYKPTDVDFDKQEF